MRGEDLGGRLSSQVGAVEIGIETDEHEAVPLGDHVLVGIVEVNALGEHGGRDGLGVCGGHGQGGHPAQNEEVLDELVESRQLPVPAENHGN